MIHSVLAFLAAFLISGTLTPASARIARRVGAVDRPRARGLADRPVPRLGGLAILAGVLGAGALSLKIDTATAGVLTGAVLICGLGAIDDVLDLAPWVKLIGQGVACGVPVAAGVRVDHFTFPFVGPTSLGSAGAALTLVGLLFIVNAVNLSDGVDGLAAGVCAISSIAFAVVAFNLGRVNASVLAALTAGAAAGFLVHNFYPAKLFMGDAGSNLLGLLMGCIAVQGSVKTNALVALVVPLVVLAVPFLDTGFVIAKRVKYRRAIYQADRWHFHHRLVNIGFSQRRTVLYLYAWTTTLAGFAVALRFVPYSDHHGHFNAFWSLVMVAIGLVPIGASLHLVVVLEILKLKRVRTVQIRRGQPQTTEEQIDRRVSRDLETGDFTAVQSSSTEASRGVPRPTTAERNGFDV